MVTSSFPSWRTPLLASPHQCTQRMNTKLVCGVTSNGIMSFAFFHRRTGCSGIHLKTLQAFPLHDHPDLRERCEGGARGALTDTTQVTTSNELSSKGKVGFTLRSFAVKVSSCSFLLSSNSFIPNLANNKKTKRTGEIDPRASNKSRQGS